MHKFLPVVALMFVTACLTDVESPGELDHEDLEFTLAGETLKSTFTLSEGFYESPIVEIEAGASRVAAMLTLTDVPVQMHNRLEARVILPDGTASAWAPMEVTFDEEELRVIRVDFAETGSKVQLRVPEEDADFIRMLTWTAVQPGIEDADDGVTTASSETGQALTGDLAAAGVHARASWGARPSRCTSNDSAKVRMAIHHTAGAPTSGGSYEAALRQIQAFHMDGRGYCDAGYHFAVTLDGRIWELRPLEKLGAHSGGYNTANAGIVLVGCFDASCAGVSGPREPTEAMIQGAARIVKALSDKFGIAINADRIKGHGQQPGQQTSCPGNGARDRLEGIRSAARNGAAPAPQNPPPPSGNDCGQVRVDTSGTALNIRPSASTAGSPVGSLADGATVSRLSSVEGQSVNGDRTWHRIRRGDGVTGYVAAAYTRCVASSPPPAEQPAPSSPSGCGFLGADHALAQGQGVHSCDGRFFFVHQGDGNVVLYKSGTALWSTGTHGRSTSSLVMQGDGNLVLYNGGTAVWHSRTHGNGGAVLAVQDDGNVVIYAPGHRAIWSTGTHGR